LQKSGIPPGLKNLLYLSGKISDKTGFPADKQKNGKRRTNKKAFPSLRGKEGFP